MKILQNRKLLTIFFLSAILSITLVLSGYLLISNQVNKSRSNNTSDTNNEESNIQNEDSKDFSEIEPSSCILDGKEYLDGESFTDEDGLNTCTCSDSILTCTSIKQDESEDTNETTEDSSSIADNSSIPCNSNASYSYTLSDKGSTKTLNCGDTFTITLEGKDSTGYTYSAPSYNSTYLRLTDSKNEYYYPTEIITGGDVHTYIWEFKAIRAGQSTVITKYCRGDSTDCVSSQNFSITIIIQ